MDNSNYEETRLPFDKFLELKGITIKENNNKYAINNITEEDILNQIKYINTFHNITADYNALSSKYIRNKLGKAMEKYKISIKNLKKDVNSFVSSNSVNEFQNVLIENAPEFIDRAEKSIEVIMNSNYIKLIKRSMRRFEICLGNTYFTNLWNEDGIKICTLKRCSYNMIEMDGVYFINKLKRNGYKMDYSWAINKFCEIENLSENSSEFMKAIISYPHEFMRCAQRYREDKKKWTINEYKSSLLNAIKKDGESILGR